MEQFNRRRKGASLTGYGLIVGLISIVALGAVTGTGSNVESLFQTTSTALSGVGSEADSAPTPDPTPEAPPTAGTSCLSLFNAGQTMDGNYELDPDGPGGNAPFMRDCDMTGGGFDVVNVSIIENVGSRHAYQNHVFNITDHGYPSDWQFADVVADYRFAGELDDANNYINSYLDAGIVSSPGTLISRYRSGNCENAAIQPPGWEASLTVNGTDFTIAAQPEGDVDVNCGNGQASGINTWILVSFQAEPQP